MKRALLIGVVIVVALAAITAVRINGYLDGALPGSGQVAVRDGAHLRGVLNELTEKGALENPDWLYAYARFTEQTNIRTGDYSFTATDTPKTMLEKLQRGQLELASFTFAEGLNRWQVRDMLDAQKWISAADFDRLCDDKDFLAKHNVPGPTCDGYFFPETYTFARGVTPESIISEVFTTYKKNYSAAVAKGSGPLNLGEREFMTLASIIEKETGEADERPRIACLFYNRLKGTDPKWRLETDPTVIYAAILNDPKFDGNLTRYHLREMDHPYNTYKRFGLPPGPIASPGRAAMDAVANPMECGDFFFVSMNNGRHVFCPTYDCHKKAVQKWQIDYFRKKRN